MKFILALSVFLTAFAAHAEGDQVFQASAQTCQDSGLMVTDASQAQVDYRVSSDRRELQIQMAAPTESLVRTYNLTLVGRHQYLASPQDIAVETATETDYFFVEIFDLEGTDSLKIRILDSSSEFCNGGLLVTLLSARPTI